MLPEGRGKHSQGALWALLGSRSRRSARGWDLAGDTLGVGGSFLLRVVEVALAACKTLGLWQAKLI